MFNNSIVKVYCYGYCMLIYNYMLIEFFFVIGFSNFLVMVILVYLRILIFIIRLVELFIL